MSVSIMTLNVRGLQDKIKRRSIFNFYRSKKRIICLQETHSKPEDENGWSMEWGSEILFSHGNGDARGVCILLPRHLHYVIELVDRDDEGRILGVSLKINDYPLSIWNIYAPNKDEPKYFLKVAKMMERSSKNRIIIGDFNLVMDVKKDRLKSNINNTKAEAVLKELMNEILLVDIWRILNEESI